MQTTATMSKRPEYDNYELKGANAVLVPWDETLEATIRAEFEGVTDAKLCEAANAVSGFIARGRATYELARRALDDLSLIPAAIAALNADHILKPKHFIPLGWIAAARIVSSGQERAITALLQAMSAWELNDRRNFLEWWLPRGQRRAFLEEFNADYG